MKITNEQFAVGDRVKIVDDMPVFVGQMGTVVGYKDNVSGVVMVELDKPYRYVHNLQTDKSYLSGTRLYVEGALEKC